VYSDIVIVQELLAQLTDKEKIIKEAQKLTNDKIVYKEMSLAHNPYGDGKACEKIVEFLRNE